MKYIFNLLFFFFIAAQIGCESDTPQPPAFLDGVYNGIFKVEYFSGDTYSNPVTITVNNGSFLCSESSNRIPAGGSGSFEINGNRITFADVNYWTAEFDWNLVLNGEYSLLQTKSTIIIQARKNDVGIYTYELDKN